MPILLSNKRLFISGDVIELYEYERPYAYNLLPRPSHGGGESANNPRRPDNLARVRNEIRRLVEANYTRYGYEPVFLTFTFAENVREVAAANKQFRAFIKRLNRAYRKRFLYLAVVEFQQRGAVHYHCIFFNMPIELERAERATRAIAKLWGNGFIDIERVRSAKRVAPYVCKYLNKAVLDPRLVGKKAFFTSRGLLRPREIRNPQRVDEELQKRMIGEVLKETSYPSAHFITIKYLQYVQQATG